MQKNTFHFSSILLFFLSLTIVSNAQEGSWESFVVTKEKGPMLVTLNMDFHFTRPNYKNLVIVGTQTSKCLKNGYPPKDGLTSLYTFSDSIASIINETTKAELAGILTYQCAGYDIFYTKDTLGLRTKLTTFINSKHADSQSYLEIKPDKRWDYFEESLVPKDLANDFFTNHEILTDLVYNGDDLTTPRNVEHWIYFRKEKRKDQFINKIRVLNFKIDSVKYNKGEYTPFELKISRIDKVTPEAITDITNVLKTISKAYYGTYDGWGTKPEIKE